MMQLEDERLSPFKAALQERYAGAEILCRHDIAHNLLFLVAREGQKTLYAGLEQNFLAEIAQQDDAPSRAKVDAMFRNFDYFNVMETAPPGYLVLLCGFEGAPLTAPQSLQDWSPLGE